VITFDPQASLDSVKPGRAESLQTISAARQDPENKKGAVKNER
jgi:hypothetical protein